jgi:hypothetical protein
VRPSTWQTQTTLLPSMGLREDRLASIPRRHPTGVPCRLPVTGDKTIQVLRFVSEQADKKGRLASWEVMHDRWNVTNPDERFWDRTVQQPRLISRKLRKSFSQVMGFLQGICNARKPPETYLKRLLISRFQVRVLGSSLLLTNFLLLPLELVSQLNER